MARTRTLTELLADVRYQADIENQTLRHTDANLTRLINQSWAAFRELICENGFPYYLTSASGNFVAGTAGYAVASDFARLYGVDVTVGGEVRSLAEHSIMERNEVLTTQQGCPVSFWLRATASPPIMVMQPIPDQAYAYTYYYLPQQTDLTTGANTIDGFNGWEDWIVFDVCLKVLTRDDDDEQFAKVLALKTQREAEIRRNAPKRSRLNAACRLDTRRMRRESRRKSATGYIP